MAILAFDTSNYTTSVSYLSSHAHHSITKLLHVPKGELGLRQQEALFQHTKALPFLMEELRQSQCDLKEVEAIAVSTKPRETEDSYMPCFLAGESMANTLATVLNIPCFSVSHQQGHMAAAAWALHREDLLDAPFFAWHLSGGTTEFLLVQPDKQNAALVVSSLLGGTQDISAGQLIDRAGQKLNLAFPSGKEMDALSLQVTEALSPFAVKHKDFLFSLSGMENKVEQYVKDGCSPTQVSAFVLDTLAVVLKKVTGEGQQKYGHKERPLPVLFCGGVASSQRLRKHLATEAHHFFPLPQYATDNAMGVAVLGRRLLGSKD